MNKANISEIFQSIQGEGKYAGASQVFVRFFECNMHCAWCDTPHAIGDTSNVPFTLFEVHADYRKNGFILIGEFGNINYENSNLEQSAGYYFDFGYDFSRLFKWEWKTIPFIRYSDYNTAASTVNGGDELIANHHSGWMVGISVLPLNNVVLKADYSIDTIEFNSDKTEYFNLGIGYRF